MSDRLTPAERKVVDILAQAWNEFSALPEEHPCDRAEFVRIIHDAQARIMCRPTRRTMETLP